MSLLWSSGSKKTSTHSPRVFLTTCEQYMYSVQYMYSAVHVLAVRLLLLLNQINVDIINKCEIILRKENICFIPLPTS